jgi:hypothetical protein
VTEVKGTSSSGATGVAVPTEAMLAGMSVGGTHTAVPGTAYGVDIDTSSSSNLAALLSNGYGTFGQSYPLAGSATGAKGSGAINPLIQADTSYNINISTNTAGTAIQAGVTNQKIYVTGWEFMAAGTTTFVLFYSTSSACGSPAGIRTARIPSVISYSWYFNHQLVPHLVPHRDEEPPSKVSP